MVTVGSHNSWSYLRPRTWWMKAISFTAKCQSKTIQEQYEAGVRCFDLRVRFTDGSMRITHGLVEYDYSMTEMDRDLMFLAVMGDCWLRVIHDVRSSKQHTEAATRLFQKLCSSIKKNYGAPDMSAYRGIRIFGGGCAYDWRQQDYKFSCAAPEIIAVHASAKAPLWDDLYPELWAKKHRHEAMQILREQTGRSDRRKTVVVMTDFSHYIYLK